MRNSLTIISLFFSMTVVAGEYHQQQFNAIKYRIYICEPSQLQLFWKNPLTQKPFKRLSALQNYLKSKNQKLVFAINAGIFEPNLTPTGLHVENGNVLNPINTSNGQGNFFLKPNGVFCISSKGKAEIVESTAYIKNKVRAELALQSGPLLLENGVIHPKVNKNSLNHRHRNGVGINNKSQVVFAISETGQKKYPTLYEFAMFFKRLNCQNALYLDGDISTMIVEPKGIISHPNNFAAILAVTEEVKVKD